MRVVKTAKRRSAAGTKSQRRVETLAPKVAARRERERERERGRSVRGCSAADSGTWGAGVGSSARNKGL